MIFHILLSLSLLREKRVQFRTFHANEVLEKKKNQPVVNFFCFAWARYNASHADVSAPKKIPIILKFK